MSKDLTLKQLQAQLPWTIHYNRDFRDSKIKHKDYQHALIHVMKAAGKLASVINDMEHAGGISVLYRSYVADLVICALRMANTDPDGKFDLQEAVETRIEEKNGVKLQRFDR